MTQNKQYPYVLVCSECGYTTEIEDIIFCPKCKHGIMTWTPREWAKK